MSKRTMAEVVAEYNKLTGCSVKRFATVDIGEKRIAEIGNKPVEPVKRGKAPAAKKPAKVPAPTMVKKAIVGAGKYKMRITVDGEAFRSVIKAFNHFGFPVNKHGKFRLLMKKAGSAIFEHNGKKYLFQSNG